jgi:hypothetical protein
MHDYIFYSIAAILYFIISRSKEKRQEIQKEETSYGDIVDER